MLINVIFIILANVSFLYLFWKRLREDYVANQIFTTAFYILVFINIVNLITRRFVIPWWFWFQFFGALTGMFLGIYRFGLRFFETFEALVISAAPSLALMLVIDYMKSLEVISLLASLYIVFLLILFVVLDKHYKSFLWYRSGRVGFSGLSIAGIYFLSRAAIAPVFPTMLSFSGKYEVFISGLVGFSCFLGVFTLARQKT